LNEYQELTNISRQTATIDLSEMVNKIPNVAKVEDAAGARRQG